MTEITIWGAHIDILSFFLEAIFKVGIDTRQQASKSCLIPLLSTLRIRDTNCSSIDNSAAYDCDVLALVANWSKAFFNTSAISCALAPSM